MSAAATVTVLGAGSILPREGYGCAGYALRPAPGAPVTLFDCGPGSVRALGPAGIGLAEVERVVLSHFHPDHCLDLLALAFARRNPSFADAPRLDVIGPRGVRRWWEGAAEALGRWVTDPDAGLREHGVDFGDGEDVPAGPLTLRCVPTGHTPEALAWRAEGMGAGSVTYTGDTGEAGAVAELAAGTTLFVAECSFPDGEGVPHHLTPSGAGRLARAAACEELLLTHFYPALDPERAVERARAVWGGPTSAAHDGSVHRVGGS